MNIKNCAISCLLVLGPGLAALPVAAQQRITVNIGSSHPTTNIWAYAMKEAFQPEVSPNCERNVPPWISRVASRQFFGSFSASPGVFFVILFSCSRAARGKRGPAGARPGRQIAKDGLKRGNASQPRPF